MIAALALPDGQARAAGRCAACPKMCRSACPTLAVTANERHQPWGHAGAYVAAAREPGGFAGAALVTSAYTCATCSACTPPCHVDGVETPELTWAVRSLIHAAGATPAVGVTAVAQARDGRVPTGASRWSHPDATMSALRRLATAGAELMFLPGCGVLGRRPAAALAAARSLRAVGVAFDVPPAHRCCGMPALTFGDTDGLHAMLTALGEMVSDAAPRRLTVQSPSCAYLLARRASALGVALPPVEPLAATLAAAGAGGGPGHGERVAYHDPCYLARHQQCRQQPRDALTAAGFEVIELAGRGDGARCSGQGGGLPLTNPGLARGYLERLLADVDAAGAPGVVTGCATCASALQDARPQLAVRELAEAVADGALARGGEGSDEA